MVHLREPRNKSEPHKSLSFNQKAIILRARLMDLLREPGNIYELQKSLSFNRKAIILRTRLMDHFREPEYMS